MHIVTNPQIHRVDGLFNSMIHTFFDMSRCIKCGRKTEYLLTCELCQTIEKRRQDDLDRRAKERREDEHRDMEARKEAAKNAQLIADSLKSARSEEHTSELQS